MDLDPPLFKYLSLHWADQAVKNGSFRITTFETCRSAERIGNERVDGREGTALIATHPEYFDASKDEEWPFGVEQIFGNNRKVGFKVIGGRYITYHHITDVYLFCMSSRFGRDLFERFKCDACLVIRDPAKFRYHLSCALYAAADIESFLGIDDVDYGGRAIDIHYRDGRNHWDRDVHPAFIKPKEYQIEDEVRSVWLPRTLPIEPINIVSREAAACCELIELGKRRRRLAIEMD